MTITKLIEKANYELNANLNLAKFCNDYTQNKGLVFSYKCGASSFFTGNCDSAIREYINELYLESNIEQSFTLWVHYTDNSVSTEKVFSISEGERNILENYDKNEIWNYEINPNF